MQVPQPATNPASYGDDLLVLSVVVDLDLVLISEQNCVQRQKSA